MAERWRQGTHSGHNIYLQSGKEPSKTDRQIGAMFDPKHAAIAVAAVNGQRVPTPDYASAWVALLGYIRQAEHDETDIAPADLVRYMAELKREAMAPVRKWIDENMRGGSDG